MATLIKLIGFTSQNTRLHRLIYPFLMVALTGVWAVVMSVTLIIAEHFTFHGDIIAFVSRQTGNLDIYTLTFDRNLPGMTRNLTANNSDDSAPVWSPDGARLAFVSNRDGRPNAYTMNAMGADIQQVTHFNDIDHAVHMLAWSPDGTQLAFTANFESQWFLYRMNADGENIQRLWHRPIITSPIHWSPDGRRIVFTATNPTNKQLFVLDIDSGEVQSFTDDIYWDAAPNWSPDGTQIVYRSHRGGNFGIYLLDVLSGEITRLTDRFSENFDPVWSPDASRILYLSRPPRVPVTQLYLMNPDGSGQQRLFSGVQGDHYSPSWRPRQ